MFIFVLLITGLIAVIEPKQVLPVAFGVLVLPLIFYGGLDPINWVPFSLAVKPIVDLAWRWRFFEIAEQGVNLQTLMALLIILTTGLAFLLRRKRIVVDAKGIILLASATFSVLITPTSWGINELIRLYASISFLFTAGIVLGQEESFNKFAKYFILAASVPVLLSFLQRAGLLPFEYWDWIEGKWLVESVGLTNTPWA